MPDDDAGGARLPEAASWEGLPAQEAERRSWLLAEIGRRVAEDGPRRAVADPARGRLFIPFAALDGYGEMLDEVERDAAGEGLQTIAARADAP